MRISLLPAVLASALWISCSSTKVEKGVYGKDRPKYNIQVTKDGKKQGKETWWHPNGQLKYEALNRNGIRDGRFTAWYPTGIKWYEGYEYHGKPESTLTYWYSNGKMKSQALYRDGIQLERKDWDESGRFVAPRSLWMGFPKDPDASEDAEGSGEQAARLRQASLKLWAMRVRQTVESYWRLPKELAKKPLKSIAKIKVDREGRILNVVWIEKSPVASFNTLAQQTFKKIKKLPPFPPQVKDETLEIQYEFVSQGKAAPRLRLEARGSQVEEERAEDQADPGAGDQDQAPAE